MALILADSGPGSGGLSSFGREVHLLDRLLNQTQGQRFFLALDEFARGTNPQEGAALARALAAHYKGETAVKAWQIDNEIGHEGSDLCWCETCHGGFIDYLKDRYADIQELNDRWGTGFWTQIYDRFEDIPLPRKGDTPQNPALRLEWERFRARSAESWLKALADAVRAEIPNAFVLHDFSASLWGKRLDPFAIAKDLDAAAYNHYPVWGAQASAMDPAQTAFALDTARGLKGGNFWITETLIGTQGHDYLSCSPKPGESALWAAQAMAHGCSNLLFSATGDITRGRSNSASVCWTRTTRPGANFMRCRTCLPG